MLVDKLAAVGSFAHRTGGGQLLAITSLDSLDPASRAAVASSVRAGDYNLFLGAGVSLDSTGGDNKPLPSGWRLQEALCGAAGISVNSALQRAFSALNENQVDTLITKRFSPCKCGPSLKRLPSFLWKRIFTLNVDDALEDAYAVNGALQKADPLHFKDAFSESRTLDNVPIIHLHGWARTPDRGYVFSRAQYASVMADTNAWMTVLADIMPVEPFIVSGTALDEVDLDFYLARRTSDSARQDKGPSFYVEPKPDALTERECARYGLTLYVGTIQTFLDDLDKLAPSRPAAHELLSQDARSLFSDGIDNEILLSFANDFEPVPKNVGASSSTAMKFAYGNVPDWSDLQADWDVGRSLTARVLGLVKAMLDRSLTEQVLIIEEDSGVGKSTVLRRAAFELSRNGTTTLLCSALSRIDPKTTVQALKHIDGPVVIVVDNLADQAQSINNLIELSDRKDIIFLCAERSYRHHHIERAFGGSVYKSVSGLRLTHPEAAQLLENYAKRGWVGSRTALADRPSAIRKLVKEPIAVACCHILRDMRPLDRIVESAFSEGQATERSRYLLAALARVCFPGGIRYDVLTAASTFAGMEAQFVPSHPLPLTFYDSQREFVAPLNVTMAERTLERAPKEELAKAFRRLAVAIAPRVNRETIKRRSAEARLAGRLFDYEDIIKRFLGSDAHSFYDDVKNSWRWNSRYWEQVALFNLSRYRATSDPNFLDQAVQHARHAVAVEKHAFTLTTLARMLMTQMHDARYSKSDAFGEAFDLLQEAISNEKRRGRASVHAYVNLFRGTTEYIELGGELGDDQYQEVVAKLKDAKEYFARDRELKEIRKQLEAVI